jgi:uncharacterized Ntn-hydrolase superfamily protein
VTFSVLGTDDTGAIGMAVTSSSTAVGARCIHVRPGIGAVASQNVTDPRLGAEILDFVEMGLGAQAALDKVLTSHSAREHRQLCVLTLSGDAASFSGTGALGVHDDVARPGVVAAGNLLATTAVIGAVADGFANASGELEERLLSGLEAGLAAGGEAGPLHSAGLSVVRNVPWPVTDLRVDWSDSPIQDLAELLKIWLPQRDDYVTRALDPTAAPSYGVPGDE